MTRVQSRRQGLERRFESIKERNDDLAERFSDLKEKRREVDELREEIERFRRSLRGPLKSRSVIQRRMRCEWKSISLRSSGRRTVAAAAKPRWSIVPNLKRRSSLTWRAISVNAPCLRIAWFPLSPEKGEDGRASTQR